MQRVHNAAELKAAHAKGQPAIIQDIEGCDFLDGKLERLEEAHRRGVRVIQLVHYIPNPLGDYQTGDVKYNGMTAFGGSVIQELNRLGIVVDVAHSTEAMVRQAAKVTTRPLLLSHTALQGSKAMGETPLGDGIGQGAHQRFLADHAAEIGRPVFARKNAIVAIAGGCFVGQIVGLGCRLGHVQSGLGRSNEAGRRAVPAAARGGRLDSDPSAKLVTAASFRT